MFKCFFCLGAQFKAIVEYAPSQRVSKPCDKKDPRDGSITKDPDYLEFLKLIAQPVENLPSAEIQLERREAELSGLSFYDQVSWLLCNQEMELTNRNLFFRCFKTGSNCYPSYGIHTSKTCYCDWIPGNHSFPETYSVSNWSI